MALGPEFSFYETLCLKQNKMVESLLVHLKLSQHCFLISYTPILGKKKKEKTKHYNLKKYLEVKTETPMLFQFLWIS